MSKRMFSSDIVESDAFLDMPLTAQALYIHLNMNADNDGFVNPKRVTRMVGANDDDLRILVAKRFLILFDSGVVVIKHWWINNTKRQDRHTPTTYQNELSELSIKNNKSYTKNTTQLALTTPDNLDSATTWQPNDNQRLPQYNTIQDNPRQSKTNQINTNQYKSSSRKDFKKIATKSKTPDPKNYAKAVRRDEELAKRELMARDRPGGGMKSVNELFGGDHAHD